MKKIKHDYICDKCGKRADYNLQKVWVLWDLNRQDKNGKWVEYDMWEDNVNEFFCKKHYN